MVTLVAEHSDVSHGTKKQESLKDVVGRDQARRGQPVDKPATRSVRYRDREHDQQRGKDHEMLARGTGLDGDNDELLVECQEDIGLESELFKLECDQEFSQESKKILTSCSEYRDECCDENRFGRGIEFKCIFEGHSKGRFECGFKCVFKCVYTRNEKAASESWEIS